MMGMLSDTSNALFCSVPAFTHWLVKPEAAGRGGCRIWSLTRVRA